MSILDKKKGMEYLFYYMAPTPNKISEDRDQQNTSDFGQNTRSVGKN